MPSAWPLSSAHLCAMPPAAARPLRVPRRWLPTPRSPVPCHQPPLSPPRAVRHRSSAKLLHRDPLLRGLCPTALLRCAGLSALLLPRGMEDDTIGMIRSIWRNEINLHFRGIFPFRFILTPTRNYNQMRVKPAGPTSTHHSRRDGSFDANMIQWLVFMV